MAAVRMSRTKPLPLHSPYRHQSLVRYRKQRVDTTGEWTWLNGEQLWVWVNNAMASGHFCRPIEKTCYSHSPPDMELLVYNRLRHHEFTNSFHHLRYRLRRVAVERDRQTVTRMSDSSNKSFAKPFPTNLT